MGPVVGVGLKSGMVVGIVSGVRVVPGTEVGRPFSSDVFGR